MQICSGKWKGHQLLTPKGSKVRPTSARLREALFNILMSQVVDADILELFAGSGALGLEALSRGARHVTFVEHDRSVAAILKKNIQRLHASEQTSVIVKDATQVVPKLKQTFDLIFADPPYEQQLGHETVLLVDRHRLLRPRGLLFIEEGTRALDLADLPLETLALNRRRRYCRANLWEFSRRE